MYIIKQINIYDKIYFIKKEYYKNIFYKIEYYYNVIVENVQNNNTNKINKIK